MRIATHRMLAAAVLLGLPLWSGCGFGKSGDASSPPTPIGGIATVSQCPSFTSYQSKADPVFQRLCMSCHAAGGRGAGYYTITQGDSTTSDLAASNFYISRDKAVPKGMTISSSDPDGTSPLLQRLNGGLSHDLTLSFASDDYAAIREWVVSEIAQTCTIDPGTGTVVIGGS